MIDNLVLDVVLCPKDYLNREIDGSLSGREIKRIEIELIQIKGIDYTNRVTEVILH